jgi:hypothetical protein
MFNEAHYCCLKCESRDVAVAGAAVTCTSCGDRMQRGLACGVCRNDMRAPGADECIHCAVAILLTTDPDALPLWRESLSPEWQTKLDAEVARLTSALREAEAA